MNYIGNQMGLDNTGLTGLEIFVKADITNSNWGCSNTVSTSFVVPPSKALSPLDPAASAGALAEIDHDPATR
jgi:hypothetical protein